MAVYKDGKKWLIKISYRDNFSKVVGVSMNQILPNELIAVFEKLTI